MVSTISINFFTKNLDNRKYEDAILEYLFSHIRKKQFWKYAEEFNKWTIKIHDTKNADYDFGKVNNNAKLNNEDTFEIWGTGKPLREFLYVDDLANAVEFILNKNIQDDLINIVSGEEISILKLAELIKDVIGYEGSLVFDTSMPDGNPRKLLDCSLINSYGWIHNTNLETGLEKTYDWYKNNIS